MSETVCPLCSIPRPRGAKRCVCNYTFEYDRPSRDRIAAPPSRRVPAALAGSAVAAGAVAFVLARSSEHPPANLWLPTWLVLFGFFTLFGAFTGARWFLRNSRAARVVWLAGHTGARMFYAALGGALIGAAVGFVLHPFAR